MRRRRAGRRNDRPRRPRSRAGAARTRTWHRPWRHRRSPRRTASRRPSAPPKRPSPAASVKPRRPPSAPAMRAEAIATRDALCQRVETLEGDDSLEQLAVRSKKNGDRSCRSSVTARRPTDWRSDSPRRWPRAGSGTRWAPCWPKRARALDALVAEAEGLPSQDDDGAAAARWQALSREARGLTATLADASRPDRTDLDRAGRPAAVEERWRDRAGARPTNAPGAKRAAKAQQDVVDQLQRLAERARRAAEAETITLREGDRLMRDIGAGLEALDASVGNRRARSTRPRRSCARLQEKVAPRVRELREMDDWRRFANAQRQEQLIAMAEAIVASLKTDEEAGKTSDLAATARALRELHAKWQEVAEAPRQSAQRLWDRFRTATDFIRSRCETLLRPAARGAGDQPSEARRRWSTKPRRSPTSADWGKAAARFAGAADGLAGARPRAARSAAAIWRSASARRATRSSRAAARISRPARRPGPTTSRRRKRSASAPKRSPSPPTGTPRRPR